MTNSVGCIVYKPVQTSPIKLKGKGFGKKLNTAEEAIAYFEAKLAKWTEITSKGGKLDILIPNMAFRAYLPTGVSVYYEMVL